MRKMLKYVLPVAGLLLAGAVILFLVDPSVFFTKGKNGKGIFGRPDKSGLTLFRYASIDGFGRDGFTYEVKDGTVFYTDDRARDLGTLSMPADPELLGKLNDLYLEHEVYRWDGFDKRNPHVLDGGGFSLSLAFADGKDLYARGSNAYPKGFGAFRTAVWELLSPYGDTMLEEAGFTGE